MLPEETIPILSLKTKEDWLMEEEWEDTTDNFIKKVLQIGLTSREVQKICFVYLNPNVKFKVESGRRQCWKTTSWMTVLELGNHPIGTEGAGQRLGRGGIEGRRSHQEGLRRGAELPLWLKVDWIPETGP